jgi:hypothetical protein
MPAQFTGYLFPPLLDRNEGMMIGTIYYACLHYELRIED